MNSISGKRSVFDDPRVGDVVIFPSKKFENSHVPSGRYEIVRRDFRTVGNLYPMSIDCVWFKTSSGRIYPITVQRWKHHCMRWKGKVIETPIISTEQHLNVNSTES